MSHAAKECLVRLVEPRQHVLQDMRVQLGLLLEVGGRDARSSPGGETLLQGGIVEGAAPTQRSPKRPLLFRSGVEFVLIRLAYYVLPTVCSFILPSSA